MSKRDARSPPDDPWDGPAVSLATRCSNCNTVFRVVQDQLKVSEGWVRCGRCNQVFNALEGLFDLERDPQSPADEIAAPVPAPVPVDPPPRPGGVAHETASSAAPQAPASPLGDKIDAQLKRTRPSDHPTAPAISPRDRLDFPDAQFGPEIAEDDTGEAPAIASPGAEAMPEEAPASEAPPEFVQRAQRAARWQSGRMRALQGAALFLLAALLGLQAAHHDRDLVAARWPALRPALSAWCAAMACTIEAPRRIDDVAVESTALTRAASELEAFRLSVVLRNRGTIAVAQPSIDLSLTDPNGQLIARRMLAPRDLRIASAAIEPGAESTTQLLLSAGAARVTGYTVEIFYP
jgi:predicted Zn finger-like uncharacterized protein